MNEEDTRAGLTLRDRLVEVEPALAFDPSELRIRAQVSHRRRRWVAVGGAAALAVGLAGGGWVVQSSLGDNGTPAASSSATFSPEQLVASLQSSVATAQSQVIGHADTAWQLETVRAQVGPTSKLLTGTDRAQADRWQARLTDGPDHIIDITLVYVDGSVVETLQKACSTGMELKHYDLCTTSTTAVGNPTQYIERAAYPMEMSWPIPNDPNLTEPVPATDRWYLHQAEVINPDGLLVMATEVVHTPSSTSAAGEWTLTQDQLTQIASDPALSFPR